MKNIKLGIFSIALAPAMITPTLFTSCSVYTDLMNGYKPGYEQISGKISKTEALDLWFKKAKETSDFVKQESFWSFGEASKATWSGKHEEYPLLTYKQSISTFSSYFSYSKISNYDQHRLSYKFNSYIESKDEYYFNNVKIGTGITHYTIDYEFENIEFDAEKIYEEGFDKHYWFIKPAKFDYENGWTDFLENDEVIRFNLRYLIEVYDLNGLQSYGFESTEASVMDKDLSYLPELSFVLDYFCGFFSYYLNNCELK